MERLTKTYKDGTHGAADDLPCGENSYEFKALLLERLGRYEDTGLTPEEIMDGKLLTGWIPVGERLPEEGIDVLVTVSGKFKNITFDSSIQIGSYYGDGGWLITEFLDWDNPDVLAWMPMPEPYRPEKEGE